MLFREKEEILILKHGDLMRRLYTKSWQDNITAMVCEK